MKTVLILAGLVAVALAGAFSHPEQTFGAKTEDQELIIRQKKVLSLLEHVTQVDFDADYYKYGKDYDISANLENYTNKQAAEKFLLYFRNGMIPDGYIFSVYNEECKEEAIALYHLFFYAKDFETFYKTAAWARINLNEGLFVYSFSIAVIHRADTRGIVLPAPYEIYPFYFVNSDVIARIHGLKMQRYTIPSHVAESLGMSVENKTFTINANYSGWINNVNKEQDLTYFTEDIGLNTYHYYFHIVLPFWMNGEQYGPMMERRGERYFHFYQQLLARFYMERLSNGLGEIPVLTWRQPIQTGYIPSMVNHNLQPFVERSNWYQIQTEQNFHDLDYLEAIEMQFLKYLEKGQFKPDVDVNFVGNFWESNANLNEKTRPRSYEQYYDILAHVLLGASPKYTEKYDTLVVALEHSQTALRDPVFFQLYKHIMYYFLEYKQYLEPYTSENLDFVGVKINDVKTEELITYFDYFTINASNAGFYSQEELGNLPYSYLVRQARLNHKSFKVTVEIESDVSTDAVLKFFLAPKYDGQGHEITLEDNWMNFVELDIFKQKLTPGKNTIVRNSEDFFYYKEDSISTAEFRQTLQNEKIPVDMSEYFMLMPNRLMLPRGTNDGFPFQFFVVVYPYVPLGQEYKPFKKYFVDNKPMDYPFDRPVNELNFYHPNMYFEDVLIKHEGDLSTYTYLSPLYKNFENVVSNVQSTLSRDSRNEAWRGEAAGVEPSTLSFYSVAG